MATCWSKNSFHLESALSPEKVWQTTRLSFAYAAWQPKWLSKLMDLYIGA